MDILQFDGNYILQKNVHTLHKMGTLYGDLWNSLENNINKYININNWHQVIFVSDSKKKSWRKQLLDQYKATRVRQDDIDWEFVFDTYDQWKQSITDKCIVLCQDHIEGDDWITSIIMKYNKQFKSVLTVASDKDLLQLVKYNIKDNKSYINIQITDVLNKELVYLPEGWEIWLKHAESNLNTDVFALDNGFNNIKVFNKLINDYKSVDINHYQQLFEKLVKGDKSDNIDSVYKKLTSTGKLQGIGDAGATKIWNFYKENYNNHFTINDQFKHDIINCIEVLYKKTFTEDVKKTIFGNIDRNVSIMELHYKHFPDLIMEQIIDQINEKIQS